MSNSQQIKKALDNARRQIGENMRSIRKRLSLSQEELGLRINADQAYVSRLEGGQLNPTLESLVEIAVALEVDLQELLIKQNQS